MFVPPSISYGGVYWDLLEEKLEAVLSSNKEHQLFLTGDFNVDILDNAHPRSRNLEYFQSFFNLINYVDAPTRYAEPEIAAVTWS